MKNDHKNENDAVVIKAVEKEIVKKVHIRQCKELEREIQEIKSIKAKKGATASVFHLKNKVTGPK